MDLFRGFLIDGDSMKHLTGITQFLEPASADDAGRAPNGHLPLYVCAVEAGFPSPADDYMEGTLDLNEYLVKHPAATFFVKAAGESMIKAGIHPGDILIVDRSLEPEHGKIVIVALDGQLTVKRLHCQGGETHLSPENDNYQPIKLEEGNDLVVWGVVTFVLHKV